MRLAGVQQASLLRVLLSGWEFRPHTETSRPSRMLPRVSLIRAVAHDARAVSRRFKRGEEAVVAQQKIAGQRVKVYDCGVRKALRRPGSRKIERRRTVVRVDAAVRRLIARRFVEAGCDLPVIIDRKRRTCLKMGGSRPCRLDWSRESK